MCGIAAILNLDKPSNGLDLQIISMTSAIAHRGPDNCGHILIDTTGNLKQIELVDNLSITKGGYNLAFGHRRLSIIDLSPLGRQPMTFADCTIVYNGEIYNYRELGDDLKNAGHVFISQSDTEVLLHAYVEWGEDCLARLNGIFAFVIWDAREKRLFGARDRLGVKPIYYLKNDHVLLICSEIKGILAVIEGKPAINERLVYDFLTNIHLDHCEETFFKGINKIPAGCCFTATKDKLIIRRYWDITDESQSEGSPVVKEKTFHDLFHEAIRLQMRADVPVGCCLSGGLDSSSVVSVASSLSSYPMRVFTARFREKENDEWAYAQAVHQEKSVEPYYVFGDPKEFWLEIGELAKTQEEPFGGPGVFVQWRLMKLIKEQGIKVVLDGQGGDELLCGYAKYFYISLSEYLSNKLYGAVFTGLADAVLYGGSYLFSFGNATRYLPGRFGSSKKAHAIMHPEFERQFSSNGSKPLPKTVRSMQLVDILENSLPVLLRYEDKNSMAFSIEARVPFLDHRLVEFCVGLPTDFKIRKSLSKYILRQALKGEVPAKILNRRSKLGFGGDFRSWVQALSQEIVEWVRTPNRRVDRFVDRNNLASLVQNKDPLIFLPIILDAWMEAFDLG
jgi:asparagine synthase (glutamine-hydrolysing)